MLNFTYEQATSKLTFFFMYHSKIFLKRSKIYIPLNKYTKEFDRQDLVLL